MSGYDWILFIMQLVSTGSRAEEASETEPILSQPANAGSSKESPSSCEISPLGVDDDGQNIDDDECCNLVNQDLPQCRICLDTGDDDLIAPCQCKGTQKYVHRSCLDNWRSTKVVALLSMLVYRFYGEELREMFGYEEHPYGFYIIAILAVILVGLLYGFFIAIICGQRINERHYHILAKQELTKEYVVESRDENKNFPELEPAHVKELRMLGLY
ncbi:E3 ubiquitin-protein ligase MARCHF1-like isoform X4 [Phoenix dactylifera]|uniref:E3 ubiquitin-protein ligase MARCHF1-like isoform X4 n=1 Tax=Phoenix dactylifera TaxID=42345 RepID=A0A8B7CFK5_PHODC|nr:E3 ubiquitin-protein ligase MARCHF1-like isoform X4 [Phoenix dactylifera]